MARVLGDSERLKYGVPPEAVSVRARQVVSLCVCGVAVCATEDIPVAAVLLAVSVKVLIVLVGVVGFVLNDAVTPFGRPDAAKVTFQIGRASGREVVEVELVDA